MIIYIILLCIIELILLLITLNLYRKIEISAIRNGTLWYMLLLILNIANIIFILSYYRSKSKRVGITGAKGKRGHRGIRGKSNICSQCGLDGKKMKPIYGTNINDFSQTVDDPKLKMGKCEFPFVHNDEYQYKCVTEIREDGIENDSPKSGWCATSKNVDNTYKTFGYCNKSADIMELEKQNIEKAKKRREYIRNNTGILDLRVVVGNRSNTKCPNGYIKINNDLNKNSDGKYIFLCKKEGLGSFGIKNIKVVGEGEDCGSKFRKSPYDLNKDSGGKKLYLCKEKSTSNFITDIRVVNNKDDCPTDKGYTISSGDLNEGSKTDPDPVYLCVSKEKSSDVYIDTIFSWGKNGITYFFKGDSYWKIDDNRQRVSKKYPQRIKSKWGDLPDNLDAVFTWGKNGVTYFFKGNKYWEFDDDRLKIKPGYPKFINNFWKGVPDNINSVFTWGKDNKTYFFKGNMYYKFNDKIMQVERGYPR